MDTNNYFEGWKYISALFNLFQEKAEKNSHITPRYIFRGISKRFFTESEIINKLNKEIMKESGDEKDFLRIAENSLLKNLDDKHNKRQPQALSFSSNEDIKKRDDKNGGWIYNLIYNDINDKLKKTESCNDISKDKSTEIGLLKGIEESYHYNYIKPEQIRSGTSVRLRDTEEDYTTMADYLSYTKNLISDFKTNNPTYKDYYDLEILAEMQHKGGASCLVDFSNNFLISLWFAVNDHHEDLGYLFCYDVNADAFIEDNLTYLNNVRCKQDVEDLLRSTRKITSYLVGDKHRFWLWRPSNINGRIARQDSVFVFGVEKFLISKHHVEVIPIPPLWKKPILQSLKVFFGTTADSIFPDSEGFSFSNSKTTPIRDNTLYINTLVGNEKVQKDLKLVQKGMSCLLKGNYRIALDYFLKYYNLNVSLFKENGHSNSIRLRKVNLEVMYSIGLCYSKLGEPHFAIDYFEESVELCKKLLFNESKVINNDAKDLLNKYHRIIDDCIDTLYDIKDYSRGINFIGSLLDVAGGENTLAILQVVYNCMMVLQCLQKNNRKKIVSKKLEFKEIDNSASRFCKIINKYNLLMIEYVKHYKKGITLKQIQSNEDIASKRKDLEKEIEDYTVSDATDSSLNWLFEDVENEMENYFKDSQEIVRELKRLTVKVQKLQYSIQCNKEV